MGCGRKKPAEGWGELLGAGDLLDRHYRILRPLAVGGAGATYLAQEEDAGGKLLPVELAIKVLYTQRDSGPFLRRLANEAQILQELDDAHIVECRGFVHRTGHAPYLVTRYERGGTLRGHVKRVGPLSAVVAGAIVRQILLALKAAHRLGVVHRDLKPENVLLTDLVDAATIPTVRVADFGIAKLSGGLGDGLTRVGSFVGTPEYAAPEQFEGTTPGPAADIFATGGLLYTLLTGQPPVRFAHRNDTAACYAELLLVLPPKIPIHPEDAHRCLILQDILNHTMVRDAEDRWPAERVIERLDDLFSGAVHHAPSVLTSALDTLDDDELQEGGTTFVWGGGPAVETTPIPPQEPVPAPRPAAPQHTPTAVPFADEPAIAPPPPKRALSLDDLFGPTLVEAEGDEDELVPTLFEPEPPKRPSVRRVASSSFFDAPEPEPELPAQVASAGVWAPQAAAPLPGPLPTAPRELLRWLGAVAPEQRPEVLRAMDALGDTAISDAASSHRAGEDAQIGSGIGLWVAQRSQPSYARFARALLDDPDAGVRACAFTGLGAVATGGLLAQVARGLGDADPGVRAASARAVGGACQRTGQQAMGRGWLSRVASDPAPQVQDAYRVALTQLG